MSDSKWNADGQIWSTIQPPLIPTEEDIRLVFAAASDALSILGRPPRILVLGVTSALINAPWPEGSEIHAVDYDHTMISAFWQDGEGRHCHCEDWKATSLPDSYFDLVVGDCSFNALPGVEHYTDVLQEIARISQPGAPLICRFFMQSEPRLTPQNLAPVCAGKHLAGIRLLLLLAAANDDGSLFFGDVRDKVVSQCGDFDAFLRTLDHDDDAITRTNRVLDSGQRLNYPSRAQIEAAFAPFYTQIAFAHPGSETGAHCPTVHVS